MKLKKDNDEISKLVQKMQSELTEKKAIVDKLEKKGKETKQEKSDLTKQVNQVQKENAALRRIVDQWTDETIRAKLNTGTKTDFAAQLKTLVSTVADKVTQITSKQGELGDLAITPITRFHLEAKDVDICGMKGNFFVSHERIHETTTGGKENMVHKVKIHDLTGQKVLNHLKTKFDCSENKVGQGAQIAGMTIGKRALIATCCGHCKMFIMFGIESDLKVLRVLYRTSITSLSICSGPNDAFVFVDQLTPRSQNIAVNRLLIKDGCQVNLFDLCKTSQFPKIAYDSASNMFFVVSKSGKKVEAYCCKPPNTEYSKCWAHKNKIDGNGLDITAICSDDQGRVYIGNSDGPTCQILVLSSETGNLIYSDKKFEDISGISCSQDTNNNVTLLVRQGNFICWYSVRDYYQFRFK